MTLSSHKQSVKLPPTVYNRSHFLICKILNTCEKFLTVNLPTLTASAIFQVVAVSRAPGITLA